MGAWKRLVPLELSLNCLLLAAKVQWSDWGSVWERNKASQ